MNVTIKLWTAPSRQRKDSTFPVCLEIKKNRLSLDIYAIQSEWSNGQFNRTRKGYKDDNKLIAAYKKKAEDIIYQSRSEAFNWKKFKAKFQGTEIGSNYLEYHSIKKAELLDAGRVGTALVEDARNSALTRFVKSQNWKVEKFDLSEIDVSFLQGFEKFLRKTCGDTTIGIYMRSLRALINKAIEDDLITSYPFGKGKYSIGKNTVKVKRNISITKEQIRSLEDLDHFHIDLFLFSYYCRGINLEDICHLKKDAIVDGKLIYFRHKTIRTKQTPKPIVIKLLPKAMAIIEKQISINYLFPIFNEIHKTDKQKNTRKRTVNRDINKTLKELACPKLGIDRLTFYSARHSYANVLKDAGVGLSVISQALGHESEQTTRNYLSQFSADVIDEADRLALL